MLSGSGWGGGLSKRAGLEDVGQRTGRGCEELNAQCARFAIEASAE